MKHEPPPAPVEGPPSLRPVKALRFVVLIALVGISVAAMGITSRRKDEEKLARWTVGQATPDVAVIKATRDDQTKQIELPGDVEAYDSASIHGQVSGYVREWRVDIGARVKKGEVLAVVDTPELDQRVTASEGELAKAKAKQVFAGVTANRWKTLGGSAAVSQQAIDEKSSDVLVTDADVSAARANLDRLRALKAFSNITAPFDGVVTARDVDIGSLVMPGSAANKPLFVVADLSQVRVYVHAPQVYGSEMKEGMQAKLILPEYPGREFLARISTTSNAIDAKSRSLLVELIADNPDGLLKPGAFAQVNFQLPPNSQSVSLPASALLFRDEAILVATVDDKSHIKLKKIRIARDYGSRVEVADGLSPDDEIVKNPLESMSDGDQVRIVTPGSGEDAGGAKANPKLAEGAMK
jgi:RND family efflux transporter MFP subunit